MWLILATKYKYTRDVVYHGWTPVICAVAISSVGGLILDYAVTHFHGLAVFQPVINGVGGNLVAVQASRLATSLHRVSTPGIMPENAPRACANPCTAFCGKGPHSRTARVLLGLVVPGHLLFMCAIALVGAGHTTITARFTAVYLLAAVIQVIVLLYLANWMVHFMWKSGDDPDNFAIPYLTAVGDFLGTALLALAFQTLHWMGDKDGDVGE
ncbi:solute carrier family 41 member 1-like [Lingula anatina]|uniref:Solute carrier family 41 member 1-like n=1 Tax=Lingula anatina TaxID=7574 RepID=A0A1S3IR00_LINAN|nr:solute carrier family 41 member 1-like [Lingula anatina]|eukprot:XP_013400645.1 solute carrier family 41 member 1-like [Lingula anatina]